MQINRLVTSSTDKVERIAGTNTRSFPKPKFSMWGDRQKNSPLRELGWTSVTGNMLNLQDTSNNTKDEPCSGRITSKMLTDNEQYSQSKVRQLHKWQRQIFWISFAKLCGIGGEGSDALLSVHDAPRLVS